MELVSGHRHRPLLSFQAFRVPIDFHDSTEIRNVARCPADQPGVLKGTWLHDLCVKQFMRHIIPLSDEEEEISSDLIWGCL